MLALIPILLILWTLGWTLRTRLATPIADAPATSDPAAVSIIIPARNEAHNLPRLLDSITAQPQPPHEILVVDDGSTDGTAEVAARHGATVIRSAELPKGWRGKTWACHQGAQAASGGLLCFLDADTWLADGGLRHMFGRYRGGALSIGPWHVVRRPYESLSLFFNLAMVAGTVPGGLFGQMLLVSRSDYERVGGHEAVKSKVLENVHLKECFDHQGIPTRSLPGRGILHFRMYPDGIAAMLDGWTKGFASGAQRTPPATMSLLVLWMAGLTGAAIGAAVMRDPLWLLLYLAFAAQTAVLARKVGSFPVVAALLYPLPLVFFFTVFSLSAWKGGRNVNWKGRTIDDA